MRISFLKKLVTVMKTRGVSVGEGVSFSINGKVYNRKGIVVGNNVFISSGYRISGPSLVIGDDVIIGPNLLVETTRHLVDVVGSSVYDLASEKSETPVVIGSDVWIGANVTIVGPVTIGDGCIVGAGSVVVKNLPPYTICGGVPAEAKKDRFTQEEVSHHVENLKVKQGPNKPIVFFHPPTLFYKIKNFNYLFSELRCKEHVYFISRSIKSNGIRIEFDAREEEMSFVRKLQWIHREKPKVVINSLFGGSNYLTNLMLAVYCRVTGIEYGYYGHGFDLRNLDSKLKLIAQNVYLSICSKIVLYHHDQMEYLWESNKKKTTVAYNTLVFNAKFPQLGDQELRSPKEKIVLFCGRIQERKKLSVLVEFFKSNESVLKANNAKLLIVGPNEDWDESEVDQCELIEYLGPIYDERLLAGIFRRASVFCIPGLIGLAIVEAFYYGVPVITSGEGHGPEIGYIENGENGYVLKREDEIGEKILEVLLDENVRKEMSKNARNTFDNYCSGEKFVDGFRWVNRNA